MTGSLYFHVPFCKKKCPYCHFFVINGEQKHIDHYLHALYQEWKLKEEEATAQPLESIYFGGGTPTEIGAEGIGQILSWVKEKATILPNCEITVETNPENVTPKLIQELLHHGVNRLSIGVQSFVDENLIQIGRAHSSSSAQNAIHTAYENGMKNITIDLMYDLPHQTVASFSHTLDVLSTLPISHLSLYNLVVEPGSAYYRKKEQIEKSQPHDSESLKLLQMAIEAIEAMGLKRYEISAFAKPGFEAVHNSRYWLGKTFYGLGPSAFSYSEGKRYQNVCNLPKYCHSLENGVIPIDFEEKLPYPRNVQELLAVELRLLKGVDLNKFNLPDSLLQTLERLIERGWLKKSQSKVSLSDDGILFYDSLASEIV